jgi:hypothetical protein
MPQLAENDPSLAFDRVDDGLPASCLFGDEKARNSGHAIALQEKKMMLKFAMETRTVRE